MKVCKKCGLISINSYLCCTRGRGGRGSPGGIPYLRSIPVGLEGVVQSMLTSFLRHWSMSTELKNATDCGRSCIPNACAKILLGGEGSR